MGKKRGKYNIKREFQSILSGKTKNRFWSKIKKTRTCWNWIAALRNKYGALLINKSFKYAHRLTYEAFISLIPKGLTIDHLCRNKLCVNPKHLEAVTLAVNKERGNSPAAINTRKTHCHNGHEFTRENTIVNKIGKRRCRTCHKVWRKLWD